MRFSWTGLILAPLLVPLILSAALLSFFQGDRPVLLFLILLVPSCVVSYGTTIFLFLPSLFLLSVWRPMTGLKACLLGWVLGAGLAIWLINVLFRIGASGDIEREEEDRAREYFDRHGHWPGE